MKIAIVGSRTFNDYDTLEKVINEISKDYKLPITEIISGGAKGADSLGEEYAKKNNIKIQILAPNWALGKTAGVQRNIDIIDACDVCVAFWDGSSKGTKNDIDLCQKKEHPCFIYNFTTKKLRVESNGSPLLGMVGHMKALDGNQTKLDAPSGLKVGSKVEHENFGKGVVKEVNGNIVTVEFVGIGEKKILAGKLKVIEN